MLHRWKYNKFLKKEIFLISFAIRFSLNIFGKTRRPIKTTLCNIPFLPRAIENTPSDVPRTTANRPDVFIFPRFLLFSSPHFTCPRLLQFSQESTYIVVKRPTRIFLKHVVYFVLCRFFFPLSQREKTFYVIASPCWLRATGNSENFLFSYFIMVHQGKYQAWI